MRRDIKIYAAFTSLFVIGHVLSVVPARASEPPIPPKRPAVMNVSPAYVEYLKNRNEKKEISQEEIDYLEAQNQPLSPQEKDIDINDINAQETLKAIQKQRRWSPPVPRHKPTRIARAEGLNDIESLAGEESAGAEETIVSFEIKPGEIRISESIQGFLETHALRLLTENPATILHIHAYATSTDNTRHSDVRLSLARALEIRGYLIDKNISPTRLKLSPLGSDKAGTNHDRIDLVFKTP